MKPLQIGPIIVRPAKKSDLKDYIKIQKIEWKNSAVAEKQAVSRFKNIINNILVAENKGMIIGAVTTYRISEYDIKMPISWYQVTNNGYCDHQVPKGKILFGVDLSVDTTKAPSGTVDALFIGGLGLLMSQGVKYFMLGGRMPKYHNFADKMTPQDYLYSKKANGHYLDPQVDMYTRIPFMKILGLAPNYFKDPASKNYGVILRFRNPFFGLPGKTFWAMIACSIFKIFLSRQRKAYKRLEKIPQ